MNLLLWTACATDEHLPLMDEIKSWGFDGVELPIFDGNDTPWDAYTKKLGDLGLGCTTVTCIPEGTSLLSEDASERDGAMDFLKRSIDASAMVGADTMVGPIYDPVGNLVGRGPTDEEIGRCAECLRVLGDYSAAAGVAISVEPLNRFETYFLNAQEQAAHLLAMTNHENVGVLYDTFHANIEEKSITNAIKAGGAHINHVHISANDRGTPGEDHVLWEENFAALKEIGYDGWMTIESFGSWLPDIARATCIWRSMAPGAEHVATEGLKHIHKMWG
jgi:D-psicose/D-tagatose/L-ribulose 3-epimerase